MAGEAPITEQTVVLSGGSGECLSSARAGFLPIALTFVPAATFKGIPFYLRPGDTEAGAKDDGGFTLYRSGEVPFTEDDGQRLLGTGVRFVYVRMANQSRLRQEIESSLESIAGDPALAISERSAIVYETSTELINEVLTEPHSKAFSERIDRVSRATATLVMDDPTSFSHLFAASHHDFYTATHMVNVATYMVPLAHALGRRDPEELTRICQAGLLHDIGKVYVPERTLNRAGQLTDQE